LYAKNLNVKFYNQLNDNDMSVFFVCFLIVPGPKTYDLGVKNVLKPMAVVLFGNKNPDSVTRQ